MPAGSMRSAQEGLGPAGHRNPFLYWLRFQLIQQVVFVDPPECNQVHLLFIVCFLLLDSQVHKGGGVGYFINISVKSLE